MAHYDYSTELLEFWSEYSRDYRELIPTYEKLLEQKRKLKLPLDCLTKTTLRELPEIPFLRCETEDQAKDFINNIIENEENPDRTLFILRLQIKSLKDNYSFRVISNRNKMYMRQIKGRFKQKGYLLSLHQQRKQM